MLGADQVIAGRYRLRRKLGEGGMGATWEACNESINRDFAIKFLLPSMARDPMIVQRFLQEAKAAGSLHHPSIAEVYDQGYEEIDGERAPFIVMELLRGEPLDVVLQRERTISLDRAITIGKACARALAAAHAAGIVHRDVKPANVFLHEGVDGAIVPKLLDFGVSRFLDHAGEALTVTGVIVGTPAYMSPEQFRGDETIDGRSDVWSLGVLLCRAVAGRTPFRGRRAEALAGEVTSEMPVALDELSLPPALAPIIARCLAKDPSARFASAGELADALDLAYAVDATDVMVSPTKPAKKRTTARIAIAATVVALAATVGVAWAALRQPKNQTAPPRPSASAIVAQSATTESTSASTAPSLTTGIAPNPIPPTPSARTSRASPPVVGASPSQRPNAWRSPGF